MPTADTDDRRSTLVHRLDLISSSMFIVGLVPTVIIAFIASFIPETSISEWLLFGMSLGAYLVLFVGVVAGFVIGGILAAPFWIAARALDRKR